MRGGGGGGGEVGQDTSYVNRRLGNLEHTHSAAVLS